MSQKVREKAGAKKTRIATRRSPELRDHNIIFDMTGHGTIPGKLSIDNNPSLAPFPWSAKEVIMDSEEFSVNRQGVSSREALQERQKWNEVIEVEDSDDDSYIEVVCVKKPSPRNSTPKRPNISPDSARRPCQVSSSAILRNYQNNSAPFSPTLSYNHKNDTGSAGKTNDSPRRKKQLARKTTRAMANTVPTASKKSETINLLDVSSGDESTHARPSAQEEQMRRHCKQQKLKVVVDLSNDTSDDSSSEEGEKESPSSPRKPPAVPPPASAGYTRYRSDQEPDFDSSDDEMATLVAKNREKKLVERQPQHHALNRMQIRNLRREMSPARQRTATPWLMSVVSGNARLPLEIPDDPVERFSPSGKMIQKVRPRGLRVNPKCGRSSREMHKKPPPPRSTASLAPKCAVATTAPRRENKDSERLEDSWHSSHSSGDEILVGKSPQSTARTNEKSRHGKREKLSSESANSLARPTVDEATYSMGSGVVPEKLDTVATANETDVVATVSTEALEDNSVTLESSDLNEESAITLDGVLLEPIQIPEASKKYVFDDDTVETSEDSKSASGDDEEGNDEEKLDNKQSSWRNVHNSVESKEESTGTQKQARLEELAMYDALFPTAPAQAVLEVEVRDLGDKDNLDFPVITTVDHLTKEYKDERGLPVREMVVHGGADGKCNCFPTSHSGASYMH